MSRACSEAWAAAGPSGYVIVGKVVKKGGGGCLADVWWSPNLPVGGGVHHRAAAAVDPDGEPAIRPVAHAGQRARPRTCRGDQRQGGNELPGALAGSLIPDRGVAISAADRDLVAVGNGHAADRRFRNHRARDASQRDRLDAARGRRPEEQRPLAGRGRCAGADDDRGASRSDRGAVHRLGGGTERTGLPLGRPGAGAGEGHGAVPGTGPGDDETVVAALHQDGLPASGRSDRRRVPP